MTAALQQPQSDNSIRRSRLAETRDIGGAAAASHLAHDVRNWLTVLQMYCDLLRTSGTTHEMSQRWVEELSQAVERGQQLMTSLLQSAQATVPEHPIPPSEKSTSNPLDVGEALRRRLSLFREMAGSRIQVLAIGLANVGTTYLQEPELDRILLNLVRNAIDAMPHGGQLTLEVERARRSDRSWLVLKVSDTGQGISADLLAHIFESGFSTKPTLRHANSERGFGLAIVRELILRVGGSVRVRSRIGHGTCFTMELPLLTPSPSRHSDTPTTSPRKMAEVSQMPKAKPGSTVRRNKFGEFRKGTRVPC